MISKMQESTKNYHSQTMQISLAIGEQLEAMKKSNEFSESNEKLIDFVNKNGIPWNQSQVYYLIDLYKLSTEYPKFRKCKLSQSFLKTNLGKIKACIQKDEDFWRE